ncbi:hypothetical protein TNCV_2783351 [Trichonephila clavipes]|nr:hypothetical protein TNCV_2783351 [Trichonephila clavipes]
MAVVSRSLREDLLLNTPMDVQSRVKEKVTQFCVRVKKRTEVVTPPNRRHGEEIASGRKREWATPRDLRHTLEKVGRLRMGIASEVWSGVSCCFGRMVLRYWRH